MIVKFGILGVPQNWDNWAPNRMALYVKKKEWLDTTVVLGRIARVKAGIAIATKEGTKRIVTIHQRRRGTLDKGGLYASCKPIVDGLKSELRRKVGKTFVKYPGAGLIFDDSPKFLDWEVTQEKDLIGTSQIWIEVEIPEA